MKTEATANRPTSRSDSGSTRLDTNWTRPKNGTGRQRKTTGARSGALGMAFRLGAEMVVGVAIGGVIGWALDSWLGTAPAFLIMFLLLGSGAGILNAVRSARRMQSDFDGGDKR